MYHFYRVWCQWRDRFNHLAAKNARFNEYEKCLEEAQELIDSYGNPNSRFFSSVNRLKNIRNSVNEWRGKVHDLLHSKKFITNEELMKLLNSYSYSYPICDEKEMLDHLISAKIEIENEIENAFIFCLFDLNCSINNMSSVSYLEQLQVRVNQFEIPLLRADDLKKKVKAAKQMQSKVNMLIHPIHSAVGVSFSLVIIIRIIHQ